MREKVNKGEKWVLREARKLAREMQDLRLSGRIRGGWYNREHRPLCDHDDDTIMASDKGHDDVGK